MSHRAPARPLSRLLLVGMLAGLGLGFGCGKGTTGSNAPGDSVEGSPACPRSKPRNGGSCPRGETDFCVYRSASGDHVCSCGRGNWSCASK